jgi:hypothetical protein
MSLGDASDKKFAKKNFEANTPGTKFYFSVQALIRHACTHFKQRGFRVPFSHWDVQKKLFNLRLKMNKRTI